MKKTIALFALVSMLASCSQNSETTDPNPVPEPIEEAVYQPQHQSATIDLASAKKYDYRNAPLDKPATSVTVNYDKVPYAKPIEVVYTYENGDTFTYIIPADFGLWQNSVGRFRVIKDAECTVWLQGQTKNGKFHEFVLFGRPEKNGQKIRPNSYRNLPDGEIKYRK